MAGEVGGSDVKRMALTGNPGWVYFFIADIMM